jgi:hypothetical protein
MADVTILGPDCEEEGERGRRGRRGPKGPTGSGGSGSSGDPQSFRYVVTGVEPDLSDFMVTLPAPRASDVYRVTYGLAGVAVIVGLDFPDLLVGDRTTTEFRVVATAPMQAGDQIDFHVLDQLP